MKVPKIKAPPKIRLKKATKPTNVGSTPAPKLYRMRSGTPGQMDRVDGGTTERAFSTESAAKTAAAKVFEDYRPVCERINKAGIDEIDAALRQLSAMPSLLVSERRSVERTIDSLSGLTIRVELWKVKA